MESKKGYFIDIVNGKVETAEEHDERILTEFAKFLGKEKCDCYDEEISLYFLSEYLNKLSEKEQKNDNNTY